MLRRILLAAILAFGFTTAALAQPVIMVAGDSLSAAFGISIDQGWVALLQQRLRDQGYPHTVVNTSVSGQTTTGGLARLLADLDHNKPAIVLIELGGNDGLRGLSLKQMRANLQKMIELSRKAGAKPVIFEMRLPVNFGARYVGEFQKSFSDVARKEKIPLVPFFLASIALEPDLFQQDGLHPVAAAEPKLLDAVWPTLEPMLGKTTKNQTH